MTPYFFVPVPSNPRRVKGRPTLEQLDPTLLTGTLLATYQCLEPVHVGTGGLVLSGGKIVKETMSSAGSLVVPGSSFKGVLRSRFEAVTRSCVSAPARVGRPVRVLSRSRPDIKEAVLTPSAVRDAAYRRCDERSGLCPSCGLWGFQSGRFGQRGRVSVLDMVCDSVVDPTLETIPELFGPRLHHLMNGRPTTGYENGREVFVVNALAGRKFPKNQSTPLPRPQRVQAIPRGSLLSAEIRFLNLTPEELGGLLHAAGLEPVATLKVGGAKGHELGAIRPLQHRSPLVLRRTTRATPTLAELRAAFEAGADFWKGGADALREAGCDHG